MRTIKGAQNRFLFFSFVVPPHRCYVSPPPITDAKKYLVKKGNVVLRTIVWSLLLFVDNKKSSFTRTGGGPHGHLYIHTLRKNERKAQRKMARVNSNEDDMMKKRLQPNPGGSFTMDKLQLHTP